MRYHQGNGFTLLELIMGMSLMSVISAAGFSILFSQMKAERFGMEIASTQEKASLAMQRLSNDLRMAGFGCLPADTAFDFAGTREVRFWRSTSLDSLPRLIRYSLRQDERGDNGMLLVRCIGEDTVGHVVSSQIDSLAFDYLDAGGRSLLSFQSGTPAVSRDLSRADANRNGAADIVDIRSISIFLRTRTGWQRNGKFAFCELKSNVSARNMEALASAGTSESL
jgi:prepilin-type N-terminal cleavage/methylation domain-containing protein